jgi:hypothetical protein
VKSALLAVLLCAACKSQDAALVLQIKGQFLIPSNADALDIQVFEEPSHTLIRGINFCARAATGCDSHLLSPGPLDATLTLVESGAQHPHVKIDAVLSLSNATVGLASVTQDFQDGATVEIPLTLTTP